MRFLKVFIFIHFAGVFSTISSCKPLLNIISKGPDVPKDVQEHYPIKNELALTHYVDFHNHITLKPYMQLIRNPTDMANVGLLKYKQASWVLNAEETKLRSQNNNAVGAFSSISSYRQSDWGLLNKYKLVCTSLYAYERGLAFDNDKSLQKVKRYLGALTTGMPKERIHKIIFNKEVSPFQELLAEYKLLASQETNNPNGINEIVILKNKADLESLKNNQTGIILSIEGGHALLGNIDPKDLLLGKSSPSDVEELKANIQNIKGWPHPRHVCYTFSSNME